MGLGLAILYTAVIVLGGLFALAHGDPWLLPSWSILLPIAAAVISLLGLTRVQRSEGTLAGEKAARWGLLLSALVGLSYWGYVGATYFAITREAGKVGQDFLKKLAEGDDAGAFTLALPFAERPTETDPDRLRDQLERRFNNVGERGPKGPYGQFRQAEPARMLALGGPGTTFESEGVDFWEYRSGGYEVRLLYGVNQPQATFTMIVTLAGADPKGSGKRQWHVVWEKTGLPAGQRPQIGEEGDRLLRAGMGAREYLGATWLSMMQQGRVEDLFLTTLPPAEREPARKAAEQRRLALLLFDVPGAGALPCATPAAALARLGLAGDSDHVREATLPGFAGFARGDLVRADKGVFWAPADLRDEIVRVTREQFRRPGAQMAGALMPEPAAHFPVIRKEGDKVLVGTDVTLPVPVGAPRYFVEGRMTFECDAADVAAGSVRNWRLRSFDLVSGKPLPGNWSPPMSMPRPSGR
jgi:hypothetical protein